MHAVSLSTSPRSDEGTAAAQARGTRASRQKRLYNEAMVIKQQLQRVCLSKLQQLDAYLLSHEFLPGFSRPESAPGCKVATPVCRYALLLTVYSLLIGNGPSVCEPRSCGQHEPCRWVYEDRCGNPEVGFCRPAISR